MLAHQWGQVESGAGSVLFVSGESGAGKSSLVQEFIDTIPADATVLWGMCDPLTTPRPLGPLHDIADQLGASVAELLARGAPAQAVFAAVFEALGTRRVVLVVDDLQWADDATVDLFRFLLRRIGLTHTLLIGIVRTDDVGESRSLQRLLGECARSEDCARLDVPPLSIEGITALIGDRDLDPRSVARADRRQRLLRHGAAHPRGRAAAGVGPRRHPGADDRPGCRGAAACSTCWPARRRASGTGCCPASASASRPCVRWTPSVSSGGPDAGSASATRSADS